MSLIMAYYLGVTAAYLLLLSPFLLVGGFFFYISRVNKKAGN